MSLPPGDPRGGPPSDPPACGPSSSPLVTLSRQGVPGPPPPAGPGVPCRPRSRPLVALLGVCCPGGPPLGAWPPPCSPLLAHRWFPPQATETPIVEHGRPVCPHRIVGMPRAWKAPLRGADHPYSTGDNGGRPNGYCRGIRGGNQVECSWCLGLGGVPLPVLPPGGWSGHSTWHLQGAH